LGGLRGLGSFEGSKIGRFFVLGTAGAGGMGLVLKAHDPELDRTIALKLVRPDRSNGEDHARLLREARAMAKVSHPNVVHIHEVGSHEGSVFMAMEFVEGRTLRQWLEERTRPWTEILQKLVDAGHGIAAAHRAGLIHRDIKPGNLLIGSDGRVRMTDFGLARPTSSASDSEAATLSDTTEDSEKNEVTELSRFAGTPAYMAPERLRGRGDARSDQFSFCVMLYLALYGRHPFAGASREEVWDRMARGDVQSPPEDSLVPTSVRETILRGLLTDPEKRFPSMDAFLDALRVPVPPAVEREARNPRRERRLLGLAIAAIAIAVVSLGLVFARDARTPAPEKNLSEETARPEQRPVEARTEIQDAPAEANNGRPKADLGTGLELGPPAGSPRQAARSNASETPSDVQTQPPPRRSSRRGVHRGQDKRALSMSRTGAPAREKRVDHVPAASDTTNTRSPGDDDDGLKPLSDHPPRSPR
jgi:serine/threonine protein kinase